MKQILKQKLQLLFSIDEILNMIGNGDDIPGENLDDIRDALLAFGLPKENRMFELLTLLRDGGSGTYSEFCFYFNRFFDAQTAAAANSAKISENYKDRKYACDCEFEEYVKFLRSNNHKACYDFVYDQLKKVKSEQPEYYKLITEESRGWYFENNWLDGIGGINNSLITNRILTLKNNIDHITWLYENLSDAISRRSLNAIIKYWLTFSSEDCKAVGLYYCDVVDTAVYPFYDGEVFVDCGSYIGDTVVQYVNTVNRNYKRVYTYDISRSSIEVIKNNLASLHDIVINWKGTGEMNTEMNQVGVDQPFHGNKLSIDAKGSVVDKVKVVRLDDDIQEPVTFIKIDCEGMDKETIRGAQGLIRKYHPKLHVDSYHKLADLFEVPLLIHKMDPTYHLHLRIPLIPDAPVRFPAPAYMAI